ncbi:Hypothetical predicted protein [Drosophila guanche]|uniref:DRBM domain-containing protein n=1 Tax=Drosophila guanche TaxID=7266 RepID=A0A3B0K6F5_DROGU|nr:Hypothetical predicted protein [Drosophila guanche]
MDSRNFVTYLKEFSEKLKLNMPKFEFAVEPNIVFRCKINHQGMSGYGVGRTKKTAAHVAARQVWLQILVHPAVRVLLQEKDFMPYIREGDIYWELRLLKIKQLNSLRELLLLASTSESIASELNLQLLERSIPEEAPTTNVRMGDRVLENVPIVEVLSSSFQTTLSLPILPVSGGSHGSQGLCSALRVLHITEGSESSPVEDVYSSVSSDASSQGSPISEEEQRSVTVEEVPEPSPQIHVSRVIENVASVAEPASAVKEEPADDFFEFEDKVQRKRKFATFRELIKKYEYETKPIPMCDRHNYFKNLPKELKEEGFKIINSNTFKTEREKAIRLLYALKLPHTISPVKSISGAPLIKVKLDCSYEGIFLDFESHIYGHIIDFMRDMLV